jgi:hypothetical protein
MRLRLIIDGIPHEIDSTRPAMLGSWIMEIFGRIRQINPGTLIEIQASPSWVWQDETSDWAPDWIADSQIIGQTARIQSPRELVQALASQIDQHERVQETQRARGATT